LDNVKTVLKLRCGSCVGRSFYREPILNESLVFKSNRVAGEKKISLIVKLSGQRVDRTDASITSSCSYGFLVGPHAGNGDDGVMSEAIDEQENLGGR